MIVHEYIEKDGQGNIIETHRKQCNILLVHKYIDVNEDEMKKHKETGWRGDLADYASYVFNRWKEKMLPDAQVANVEATNWTETIKPRMDNSATWYNCRFIRLSVWMRSENPIPLKVKLTEKGRKEFKHYEGYIELPWLWMVTEMDDHGTAGIAKAPYNPFDNSFIRAPKDCFEIIED